MASVHLDLSKAFGSLDYRILLEKLEAIGIRGQVLNLFKNYLHNRTQRIEMRDKKGSVVKSDAMEVKSGVPQGSILGPYLFIIYMNDIPNCTPTSIYADDTTIAVSGENNENLEAKIKTKMDCLHKWFAQNKLELNANKTKIVQYKTRSDDSGLEVQIHQSRITSVESVNFLGVEFNERLNWKNHIEKLAHSMASFSFVLRTLSQQISTQNALMTYYAHVHSRISYGIQMWGNSVESERIFKLQKQCLRNIFNLSRNTSCRNIFQCSRIPTFTEIYISKCAVQIHKQSRALMDNQHKHEHNTRQSSVYIQAPYTHLTMVQRQFPTMAAKIYKFITTFQDR